MDDILTEKYKMTFDEIYKNKVYSVLSEFESVRKRKLIKCILLTSLYFFTAVFSFYIAKYINIKEIPILSGILFTVITFISPYIFNKNFVSDLKDKCIPEILSKFENVIWKRDTYVISDEEIKASNLFSAHNVRINDDTFTGNYKDVEFAITETKLMNKSYGGLYNVSLNTFDVFNGVIIKFTIDKETKANTIIATKGDLNIKGNKHHKTIISTTYKIVMVFLILAMLYYIKYGNLEKTVCLFILPIIIFLILGIIILMSTKTQKNEIALKKVTLEDIEFDKKYDVYSENQTEARYILTPVFIEHFKNLYTSFGTKYAKCTFYSNYLMIAISTKKNLYEIGNLYRNLINQKQIEKFMYEFTSILEMIEYFKLYKNT